MSNSSLRLKRKDMSRSGNMSTPRHRRTVNEAIARQDPGAFAKADAGFRRCFGSRDCLPLSKIRVMWVRCVAFSLFFIPTGYTHSV